MAHNLILKLFVIKRRIVRLREKLTNFRLSNLVGDVNHTDDKSITALEQLLMKICLISISPEAMKLRQPTNKSHRRWARMVTLLFTIQLIRSILYFYAKYAVGSQLMLDMLGDYFALVGMGGDVIQFWYAMYSMIVINVYYMMTTAEKNRQLNIMVDFSNCSKLVESTISSKEVRYFRLTTMMVLLSVRLTMFGMVSLVTFIHVYAVYTSYRIRGISTLCAITYTLSLMSLWPWMYYAVICFTVPSFYLVFSALYVGSRYRRLHHKFKYSRAIGSLNLDHLLKEHLDISGFVQKHHVFTKWIMFIINVYCSIIAAVSIVVPIYGHFESAMFKMAVRLTAILMLVIMVFYAAVSGSVHHTVRICKLS